MRKIIGIPAYLNEQRNSFGVGVTYLEFISKYGTPRLILPEEEFVKVDLLLLTGGLDISPSSFGEYPGFRTSNTDVFKQHFYDHRLKNYIDQDVPILGICLGMQQLAAYFGSVLTQDLKYHENQKDNLGKHDIKLVVSSYSEGLPKGKTSVNSRHHQGVKVEHLGKDLVPLFTSDDLYKDELVEVFGHKTKKIYGLQYHPEDLLDLLSHVLIKKLLI